MANREIDAACELEVFRGSRFWQIRNPPPEQSRVLPWRRRSPSSQVATDLWFGLPTIRRKQIRFRSSQRVCLADSLASHRAARWKNELRRPARVPQVIFAIARDPEISRAFAIVGLPASKTVR